ncbi:hypothetical protein [Burkholderia cepacia]|uniref:hypothetical protein n=1 Tax=Burkholderia cepacia TaxID=292 RepID=UPI000F5B7CD2|nr:hypothetical protein [Burkholderia cepacia]
MQTTHQQDVVNTKDRIATLKEQYRKAISEFVQCMASESDGALSALLAVQRTGTDYFNFVEEFVGNSELLGAAESALWAQGFAEDCAEVLSTMPQHYELLGEGFSKLKPELAEHITPGKTAFANMQRMVVKYLDGPTARDLRESFAKARLPVFGFGNAAKEFMSKKLQTILCFSFGTIFVLLLIGIALFVPNPTAFQYVIFRTVLALAGGAAVAAFPGFIEVKLGNWLRAGGALAVFTVLYLFNPAQQLANIAQPPASALTSASADAAPTTPTASAGLAMSAHSALPASDDSIKQNADGSHNYNYANVKKSKLPPGIHTPQITQEAKGSHNVNSVVEE